MKNLKYSLIAFLTFVFALSFSAVCSFADEAVYVYINNELIQYEDATPQIMNNRAMVPFRFTAEKLGAEIDWNSKTETMTLTKGSRIVVHQMRSNIITVNGEAVVFDTPSTVLQNRTMMPVRMLAEALGSQVDWDSSTRSVIVRTDEASVTQAYFNSNLITSGSDAILTVNTNTSAEKVKVVDTATQTVIAESFNYTTNSDGTKTFAITWTPTTETSVYKTVQIFAGDSASYNESASVTVGINITVDNLPRIYTAKADDTSVDKNDYVTLTVRTNTAADRIKVVNDFKAGMDEFSTFTEVGDQKEFTGKVRMTVKGECTLQVYAGNADGYSSDYQTINIDVDTKSSRDDDDDDDDDELEIIDIDIANDTVAVDEEATVVITTTTDITKVIIYNSNDKQLAKSNFYTSKSNGVLTWNLSFDVTGSGRNKYTVYAYDDNDDYDTQSFSITGENYSSNSIYVISITSKNADLAYGDTGKFVVKTTTSAERIVVKDYKSNEITTVTEPKSTNSSYYTFEFSYKIDNKNADYITVYAYDDDDNVDSKKYYLTFESSEDPEIIDVEIESKTVDEGDDIEITVYTNTSVTRVWVVDEDDSRVANKKKYDDKDGDEYIWEIDFEAEEEGRMTYTVYAENDDGDEDEYSFSIKIK